MKKGEFFTSRGGDRRGGNQKSRPKRWLTQSSEAGDQGTHILARLFGLARRNAWVKNEVPRWARPFSPKRGKDPGGMKKDKSATSMIKTRVAGKEQGAMTETTRNWAKDDQITRKRNIKGNKPSGA